MLLQNEWQGYRAPAAVCNIATTRHKLFSRVSQRYGIPSENAHAPTVKRKGHRLITDAALCIASSSRLKNGYQPAKKVNPQTRRSACGDPR
jgi:hypothetical protein